MSRFFATVVFSLILHYFLVIMYSFNKITNNCSDLFQVDYHFIVMSQNIMKL